MQVLVTGATGFIGTHVLKELLSRQDVDVIATTSDLSKAETSSLQGQVTFIETDIFDPSTYPVLDEKRADVLIHLAWAGLPRYMDVMHLEVNLFHHMMFVKHLIDAGIENICVTGTCLEYGMQEGCLREDMKSFPENPYAIAKHTLYSYIRTLCEISPFSFKWMRMFYTYGQGQSEKALVHQLDKAIAEGAEQFDMSGGEQTRDFLPVEVIASHIVDCAFQTRVEGIINCCSGDPVTVREFVEERMRRAGHKMHLNLGVFPYPEYEPMAFWGDTEKLNRALESYRETL